MRKLRRFHSLIMLSLRKISFSFVALVVVACGGATSTSNDASSQSAVTPVATAEECAATPGPTMRCGAACPYGYKGPKGTYTCECCTGPVTTPDAATTAEGGSKPDASPPCCDPATEPLPGREGVWCCGDGSWIHDFGAGDQAMSCADHAGAGTVCGGGEICGGPPPTARCAGPCPNGYKQIDGEPTCECCSP
jgi:hypothetical protein